MGGEVAEGRAEGRKGRGGWRFLADGLDVSVGLAVRVCCRMEGAGGRALWRRCACAARVWRWRWPLGGVPRRQGEGAAGPPPFAPLPPCRPRRTVAVDARRAGAPPGGPLGPLRVGQHPACGGGVGSAIGVTVDTTTAAAAGAEAVAAAGAAWPPGRDKRVAPADCRRKPCPPAKPTRPPARPPRLPISPALLPNVLRPPVCQPHSARSTAAHAWAGRWRSLTGTRSDCRPQPPPRRMPAPTAKVEAGGKRGEREGWVSSPPGLVVVVMAT